MVTALLCDLGILVLLETYPEEYAFVLETPLKVLVERQCEVEEKILGVNHAEVSAHLLKRWRMPEEVTAAILHHHHPDRAPAPLQNRAYLLYFAQRVAQLQLTVEPVVHVGEIVGLAAERFGMDDQAFRTFLEPLGGKVEEFAGILQVAIGVCEQFPTLLASATVHLTRLAMETSLDNFRVQEEKNQAEQELKKTEEVLQKTEDRLRQARRWKRSAGWPAGSPTISTTCSRPSSAIASCCSTQMPASTPQRHWIEEIKRAGERASALTRQLLAFSRKQILAARGPQSQQPS